jgi:hypothetical protein
MASHHFTTAVTEGDGSVRVLGHHGSKQPTSNSESTLRNEAGCMFAAVVSAQNPECYSDGDEPQDRLSSAGQGIGQRSGG